MKILITGHGIDALVANYVLADLGYSPTIVTPHPLADAIMFTHGPWRHTGSSKLLVSMLEDLELEHEEYAMTVALDGEDWSGKRAIKAMAKSTHTLFDRFPDIKRTLNGDDQGQWFEREKLVHELRSIASLPDAAIHARVSGVSNSGLSLLADREYLDFDHVIVTDVPTLQAINIAWNGEALAVPEQAVYRIKDASFAGRRYDSNYYAEGDVVRVTSRGDITFVQARGWLAPEVLAQFGGKLMGHESVIKGFDVEGFGPTAIDLPRGVHLLGSAVTGVDQTISDVMDVAHEWGNLWQIETQAEV